MRRGRRNRRKKERHSSIGKDGGKETEMTRRTRDDYTDI